MTTYCINLSNQEVTEYTGYDALAFERIDNKYYAVCADGIYLIGNGEAAIENDNGSNIEALAILGMTDFKSAQLKRLAYAYVGSEGEITLQMGLDSNANTTQHDATHSGVGMGTRRIKLGKGHKSRYWQPIIRNRNGSNFEIDALELLPEVLSRRVS